MNHKTCLALAVSLGAAQQAAASGFIDDSKASLDLRNFYYNQDTRNAKAASDKEWGQAFMFNYQSGFTEGTVGLAQNERTQRSRERVTREHAEV